MSPLVHRLLKSHLFLCLALLTATPACADKEPFYDSQKYNNGDYGDYVTQEFVSSDIVAPWVNFISPFTECDDGSYYFVAPRGEVADATPFILDAEGSVIWAPDHHYGEVYNFMVQTYKGEDYLTFWAGDDSVGGHGEGKYYMLDKHYEEFRTIEGANGIGADLHSFSITVNNTATCTLYEPIKVNVTHLRPYAPEAWVWDSLFQEIDIETGEALFQWRASEHFALEDSYTGMGQASEFNPWDFFHINSVDKDNFGNYLISSRFMRLIAYIDGTDGSVLWQLGGKKNNFTDLSDGLATVLVGQHDARWTADHTSITYFDNRGDWYYQASPESWGARVRLDTENMTAEVVQAYKHPAGIYTFSQGSFQTLPNGNVVIGYGFIGAYTEFSPEGEMLCDAWMEPRSIWHTGSVQSYRNLKLNWTGIPKTQPSLVFKHNALYMSWKGSTETRNWLLQHSDSSDGSFTSVMTLAKNGFETRYPLRSGLCMQQYVRVVALDRSGEELSTSQPVFMESAAGRCIGEWKEPVSVLMQGGGEAVATDTVTATNELQAQIADLQLGFAFGALALVGFPLLFWLLRGSRILAPFYRFAPADDSLPRFSRGRILRSGPLFNMFGATRTWIMNSAASHWIESTLHHRSPSGESDNMLSDMELTEEDKVERKAEFDR